MELLKQKTPETYEHCSRVALLAEKMAVALQFSKPETDRLMRGCFVHDLGKVMITREILYQRAKLTPDQWVIMKLHPELGAEMLELQPRFDPGIIKLVRHHHERWDGKGYPDRLRGEEIPLFARICAVLDAYDSMTSSRPYSKAFTEQEALEELLRHSGTQFDGHIVDVFLRVHQEMRKFTN
ncbi:HD-GYP domain-containing protein [Paenibacillus daejeonensis]|uniref:HD-GYP domain-containing protein n=1 Tax=Paenibacillus daejeonensis TaxID=135193 RepID=UPI0003649813|nr:HD-GYP domain-containing protein [Paenibacillus daejeonensis]